MKREEILAKHEEFLFPCVVTYYAEPLTIASAEGLWVTDTEGQRYLDFFGGILTVSLGHCHPEIAERISEQLGRLQHTSTLYPNEWIVGLAEKLASLTPGAVSKSFFTSSGTEADETAILTARLHAGGAGDIIALRHCYAGRSQLAINLCAHAGWRLLPTQVPGIKHAIAPYCYRCAMGLTYPECDLRCARDVEELIATETCGRIAAFIAEPVLGVGGFIVPPPGYFKVVAEITRRHGGIFISDEVQTGFGRTGTHWNGIEHFGVEPDVMCFAKGMANGFPIGATSATPEVAESFSGLTIATFGGNPVAAVAALTTLEIMEREDIPARSAKLGERFSAGLKKLGEQYEFIGEVRGLGLAQALELVEDPETRTPAPGLTGALMEETKKEGLLIGKGGLHGNVARIAPPMLVTEAEIDEALDKLGRALARVQA